MDDDARIHSLTAKVRLLEDLVVDLRRQMHATTARVEQATAAEQILRQAGAAPPRPPVPRHRRPHPHLRVVKGAALLGAGRWLVRARAHKVITTGAVLVAASGTSLAPGVMAPGPAAVTAPHPHPVPLAAPARSPRPPPGTDADTAAAPSTVARRDDARRDGGASAAPAVPDAPPAARPPGRRGRRERHGHPPHATGGQ